MFYGGDKMINFPEVTYVHRRLPKEAFYKHLPITALLKNKFVSDVDRIYVEWSLTKDNLHLEKAAEIKEILVLMIELKKQDFDARTIEAIARQNPHKLVFILSFENTRQLAIYHNKLYRSEWMEQAAVNLSAKGFSIDEIWGNLIEQIALSEETDKTVDLSIDARLKRQDKIHKLTTLIEKTEAAAWKEQQPKKKFELYQRAQAYKKELEEITNG
jgi:hypothetical protein